MLRIKTDDKKQLDAALLDLRNAKANNWTQFKNSSKEEAGLPVSASTLYRIFSAPADAIPVKAGTLAAVFDFCGLELPLLIAQPFTNE